MLWQDELEDVGRNTFWTTEMDIIKFLDSLKTIFVSNCPIA